MDYEDVRYKILPTKNWEITPTNQLLSVLLYNKLYTLNGPSIEKILIETTDAITTPSTPIPKTLTKNIDNGILIIEAIIAACIWSLVSLSPFNK